MSEPRVRAGGPADHEYVRGLGYATVGTSVSPYRPAAPEALRGSIDRLLEYVLATSHHLLVAERDGRRVGFLLALDELPDEVTATRQLFVAYMAVEETARRGGVGRALLEAAEARARALGLPNVSLMVTDANDAVAFYTRLGYLTERRLMCKIP